MTEKISRTYTFRTGGGVDADDIWYDEDKVTVYEGHICPECMLGVMKVSKNDKLYCSVLCWIKKEGD